MVWVAFLTVFALVKPEVAGKRILNKRLKTLGIESRMLSDKCLTEIVECGIGYHQYMSATKALHLKGDVEGIAIIIAQIYFGEGEYTAAKIKAKVESRSMLLSPYWQVLARHDPKQFALDRLESTQAFNRRIGRATNCLLKSEMPGIVRMGA